MAQYNGYVPIAHNTYDTWKQAVLFNGFNVDFYAGNQCFDLCSLLWWQYGLTLVTKAGGGVAADCWLVSRYVNAQPPFSLVEDVHDIKRGDIIVWNRSSSSATGHIGFADENYHGNTIQVLNQLPSKYGINGTVHVDTWRLGTFLGAFRNNNWQGTPPEPPTPEGWYNKGKYNFVLFNRRKRQEKWTKKPLKRR